MTTTVANEWAKVVAAVYVQSYVTAFCQALTGQGLPRPVQPTNPIQQYESAVQQKMGAGMSRWKAIETTAQEQPGLVSAYQAARAAQHATAQRQPVKLSTAPCDAYEQALA